jgi:hypothetical protein
MPAGAICTLRMPADAVRDRPITRCTPMHLRYGHSAVVIVCLTILRSRSMRCSRWICYVPLGGDARVMYGVCVRACITAKRHTCVLYEAFFCRVRGLFSAHFVGGGFMASAQRRRF